IECRIYAEDGFSNFAPSTGEILEFSEPGGFGVRLDHGIRAGMEITPFYDPLLGKLCTWGQTRGEAIERMARSLEELRIVGIRTTVPFCLAVMGESDFRAGEYCTSYIDEHASVLQAASGDTQHTIREAAALGAVLFSTAQPASEVGANQTNDGATNWRQIGRERQLR
ncbi:MAG: biotin carboxylase, partial [Candidatus Marinimicrobia bacterium]|nr:biotin carboxylase [Candidatus Neomarinimicrobiota bacterium]